MLIICNNNYSRILYILLQDIPHVLHACGCRITACFTLYILYIYIYILQLATCTVYIYGHIIEVQYI